MSFLMDQSLIRNMNASLQILVIGPVDPSNNC